MSLRNKVLTLALALTLAVIAGHSLSATSTKNAIGSIASAVWGS